jgi:hypothetical protein
MDRHVKKAYSTKRRNESYLEKWIVPRWGNYRPSDIKSVAVEGWLDGLVHESPAKKQRQAVGRWHEGEDPEHHERYLSPRNEVRISTPRRRGKSDELRSAEWKTAEHS